MQTVLVSGANGFVGRPLCSALERAGYRVRRCCRLASAAGQHDVAVGEIGPDTDWNAALSGVDAVVHLAARVHVMKDRAADPLAEFRRVNVAGTARLARAAASSGVRRFVYLSSIKVNGEATHGRPFSESDLPHPQDPYGVSKQEAEQALAQIGAETGLEVVVLRPPLVYGPGVKGNFLRLLQLVKKGMPLPLASIANRRSLLYVGNLADAVCACLSAPAAAGKTYLLCDSEEVSTPDLIRKLAQAMGRPSRLLPFPPVLFDIVSRLGGAAPIQRLTGSLQINSARIQQELSWHPPFSLDQGIRETVHWFAGQQS